MHSKHETNEKENNPQIRLESASNNKGKIKWKLSIPKISNLQNHLIDAKQSQWTKLNYYK